MGHGFHGYVGSFFNDELPIGRSSPVKKRPQLQLPLPEMTLVCSLRKEKCQVNSSNIECKHESWQAGKLADWLFIACHWPANQILGNEVLDFRGECSPQDPQARPAQSSCIGLLRCKKIIVTSVPPRSKKRRQWFPGWWCTYPSEKYESIGMIILNIWKNKKW